MTIHLVDSLEYARTNCWQHQLMAELHRHPGIRTVQLADLRPCSEPVVCCLKQRTLHNRLATVAQALGSSPVVVYDQDPWEAFRDGSPYKGTYTQVAQVLNVAAFALTNRTWADFVASRGLPVVFVRMAMMPELCSSQPAYVDRSARMGFVGSLHPYRRQLFADLAQLGADVTVIAGNSLPYDRYLRALSDIRIYVHSEDAPVTVDGMPMNLKDGLWARDVEVIARGCFSVRNHGLGSSSYLGDFPTHDGLGMLHLYDCPADVPGIIARIEGLDPRTRQRLIDDTVAHVRRLNGWQQSAETLLAVVSPPACTSQVGGL